jgi:formylglycine-generating enzyme required for sulfatase activity
MEADAGGMRADAGGKCPTGLPGPPLVEVPAPGGGRYCIDATEVTNAQYKAFLDTGPSTSGQPVECGFNTTLVPDDGSSPDTWPATGKDDYPVGYVDWCDAHAYCQWAGKRLCGKIGGGPNGYRDYADATKSEWFNACSMGGVNKYPYGDSYQQTTCVGNDYDGMSGYQTSSDVAQPVGSATGCHGTAFPFDAIFDLSGNEFEWEDSCDAATGMADWCRARGGYYGTFASGLVCDDNAIGGRDYLLENWGFRCCAD